MLVGAPIAKIDSSALVQGKKVYTQDLIPSDALCVLLLRSTEAHGVIREIDVKEALQVEGVEAIYTYADVPQNRFTLAGQSFPEPSPYDRLILDRHVRYVGDPVAIIAATSMESAKAAREKIRVKYDVLPAVFDVEASMESGVVIHPEEPHMNLPQKVVGYDFSKNLVGCHRLSFGEDFDQQFQRSPVKIEQKFTTQAQAQSMMETFRSYCYLDMQDRLVVVSSTQVPFHIKRQLALALGLKPSKIRVIKPRVGGAFGAKQTSEAEIFPAFVTLKTGKPSYIVYSRQETLYASNSRHATKLKVKVGAENDGTINAIEVDALSDQGAYGVHAWTTLRLMGEKILPLYHRQKASSFKGKVVYTNKMQGGAFRGYGATQGTFAVECAIGQLARKLNMDPIELKLKNLIHEGDQTLAFDKQIRSCTLEQCIARGKELIGWDRKYPFQDMGNGRYRSVGMALSMQGSGIAQIDTSTAQIKLNEGGDYVLFMSATDTGTGADTILVQMAAEILQTSMDNITLLAADTDVTPYDPGSYASSGTYTTGGAVVRAALDLKNQILLCASQTFGCDFEQLVLKDDAVVSLDQSLHVPVEQLATKLTVGPKGTTLIGKGSFGNDDSPPPYMAGFCEIELDVLTGKVKVIDFVGVVDCGTVINENLARVQAEGGIVQGLGLALFEDVTYNEKGRISSDSFMTYKIPSRTDVPSPRVEFVPSYEPTGPFGAKSIGEVVINTSAPAVAMAVANVVGEYVTELPLTPEKVYRALVEHNPKLIDQALERCFDLKK